jgi:hypothetical protein
LLDQFPKLRIITTDIIEPPRLIDDEKRLKVVKCDLGDKEQVEGLFAGEKIGGIFALQYVLHSHFVRNPILNRYRCIHLVAEPDGRKQQHATWRLMKKK